MKHTQFKTITTIKLKKINLEGGGQEIRGRRAMNWSFCDSHNIEYKCSAIICYVQDFIV